MCQNPGMAPPIRPHLRSLTAYSPGKPIEEVQRERGLTRITKLASNENPLGASSKAITAIRDAAAGSHFYPDASGLALRNALSRHTGVPAQQIALGNGSDELIHYLCILLLEPGSNMIMGDPGFMRYECGAQIQEAEPRKIPLDQDDRHDLEAMANAIDTNTRIVFIANPNNPTGTIIERSEFERFLDRVPAHVVVVLDEAYFEFADSSEFPSSAKYVLADERVIGLRTFSKTHGLAGMRIGYAFLTKDIAEVWDKVREPFNVNSLAQIAAIAALEDTDHLHKSIDVNRRALNRISLLLEKYGGRPRKSHANFVWADFGRPVAGLCEALLGEGVIVRSGAIFGRPNFVRVSSGTDENLDHLEEALANVAAGALS